MSFESSSPKLYSELASWFHLLTAPKDYAEEAEFSRNTIEQAASRPVRTVLELGCGGGNNAFHLKNAFEMTLTDLSPEMLDVSRSINPECTHVQGDMRTLRLGTEFDAVFVHDAVMYLTSPAELLQCMQTAFVHCRPGGVALFMPDLVRERFVSGVHHGGHDGEGRSLRYMEWTFDADPTDTEYSVDFVCMLREGASPVRVVHDRHTFGLFARTEWLGLLQKAGFNAKTLLDPYDREVFVATAVLL